MEKLIIAVAPTGSVPRKRDTPYLPVTPDEIAETAYLCEQEGASVIHVHCRDENENPTSDFEVFRETVGKIRKRTRLIVMVSTSGVAGKSDEDRAEPLKAHPEMASLTTGTINFPGRSPPIIYMNSPTTIEFLASKMKEMKIKPELEIFDLGFIRQSMRLVQGSLVEAPPHFQLVLGVEGGVPGDAENLLHMARQLPPESSFSVAGIGKAQLPTTTLSIILGGHVRVGLEDNIYFRKGELAPNEAFVQRTKSIALQLQREIATPNEARRILGLVQGE
ncbi:MAG: 3-keto-5-aminohexanoate cleavage protein [Candidatus Thorarchaeota archaeon]|nr:3-keto-5-aminohexanoate cleavage protein [Candidatus Thorarchaeota archaeon]